METRKVIEEESVERREEDEKGNAVLNMAFISREVTAMVDGEIEK